MLRILIFSSTLFLMLIAQLAFGEEPALKELVGDYSGSIKLSNSAKKEVPIRLRLELTEEHALMPIDRGQLEYRRLMGGTLTTDTELFAGNGVGEAYLVSQGNFNGGWLSISCSKFPFNRTGFVHFRLVGKIDKKGSISGKVIKAPYTSSIGTFKVDKD